MDIVSSYSTPVRSPSIFQDPSLPIPPPSENIVFLNNSFPPEQKEEHSITIRELGHELSQLSAFSKLASEETLGLLSSKLSEALQKEPCLSIEDYQVRIVQLRSMLKEAQNLFYGKAICSLLEEYQLHAEQAAKTLHCNSQTPVQDSFWPLYERILQLPSLEPDYFGAAIAHLNETLPTLVDIHPVVGQLKKLLPQLRPPSHYFWQQEAPFSGALKQLEEIREKIVLVLHRLKEIPDGHIKDCHTDLETILDTYRSFYEEFNKASEKKKKRLCIPKAQISGVGLAFFLLDPEVARVLLSRDKTGKEVKKNAVGTHAVHHEAGVFYKPNSDNPNFCIHPEKEFIIYALYQRLGGGGIAPTALARISHLFFEGQSNPQQRILQVGYGIQGISLKDFLAFTNVLPFLTKCLRKNAAEEAFRWLIEDNWLDEFLETHPHLTPAALDSLTCKDAAEIIFETFKTLFDGQAPEKRCIEFSPAELNSLDTKKKEFKKESSSLMVGCLALLSRYPDLAIIDSKDRENGNFKTRPVSYEELITLQVSMKKIRAFFPTLSAEELLSELSQAMQCLDSANFSLHFVATLLTNPCDHHAENLMITCTKNEQAGHSFSIVGIDNDLAFASHLESIRTMLYLLEPMNHVFDSRVAEQLLKTTPEELVLDWLIALEEQNRSYNRWQKSTGITLEAKSDYITIDSSDAFSMYAKAKLLWPLLNSSLNHWDLLQVAHSPAVAKVYSHALRINDDPFAAYEDIQQCFKKEYLNYSHVDREVLSFDLIEGEVVPIGTTATRFLRGLNLSSFPMEQQVSLIGKMLETLPNTDSSWSIFQNPAKPFQDFLLPPGDEIFCQQFFLKAVEQGHLALIARLLIHEKMESFNKKEKPQPLIEARNLANETPLLISCSKLNFEMVRLLLLQHGANPQVYNTSGQSPLMICATRFLENPGKVATIIRFLVDQPEILLNATDKEGHSILHYLVKIADEAPSEAETLISFLIEKGANPDIVDKNGKTPLDYAIEQRQERWVARLIAHRASRILDIPHACAFFRARPHLEHTYTNLQNQSLILRWNLALEALSATSVQGAQYILEGTCFDIGLSLEMCKKLLDGQGNIQHQNKYGNRNVCPLSLEGGHTLFFKQYPEMPGIEAAVSELLQLLIGHGTSLTGLAKLTNVTSKTSYPVLVAQGIQGDNLQEVLSNPIKCRKLENLDHLAYSELLCASLLVNFEDAKPDNFIVESLPGGTYRLISIDNDHAFVPPLLHANNKIVFVKSILFCLDQMTQPIHPSARERFLSFNPDHLLELWLDRLCKHNRDYCKLFPEGIRRELFKGSEQNPGLVIPVPIKSGALTEIYQKFQRLQTALRESAQLTGIELLRIVIPPLGVKYEDAFWENPTPLERFEALTNSQYKTIQGVRRTVTKSGDILRSMQIPDKEAWERSAEQGPERALNELKEIRKETQMSADDLRSIRNDLQNGNIEPFNQRKLDSVKEKIVNGEPGVFNGINFKEMRVNGAADLNRQRTVLSAILRGNYRSLRLLGCDVFDLATLTQLLSNSPQLVSLELNACPLLTEHLIATELCKAKYLVRLSLNHLPQLHQVKVPHPNLRHLGVANCLFLTHLTISHSLKSLALISCQQLSSVETKHCEIIAKRNIWGNEGIDVLMKQAPKDFVLEKLRLKTCPQLEPWNKWFHAWLEPAPGLPKREICLRRVPPVPNNQNDFVHVVAACLQRPEGMDMLLALFDCQKLDLFQGFKQIVPHPHSMDQLTAFLKHHKVSLENLVALYTSLDMNAVHENHRNKLRNAFFSSFISISCDPLPIKVDALNLEVLNAIDTLTDLQRELKVLLSAYQPNFQSVQLCTNADDTALRLITDGAPRLSSINLSACKKITKAGLAHLIELTSINLNFCEQITDEELQLLSYNCPDLTSIGLAGCDKITDKGLKALIKYCLCLAKVDIRLCRNVTLVPANNIPSTLEAFTTDCTSLKYMRFLTPELLLGEFVKSTEIRRKCEIKWTYTNDGVQRLAEEQPNFLSLNLSGMPVTDDALIALAEGSPGMTTINLSGCSKIKDAGLEALVKRCPQLSSIELSGCEGITAAGYLSALNINRRVRIGTGNRWQRITEKLEFSRTMNDLVSLDLSIGDEMTDEVLFALADVHPELRRLVLGSCNKLTDRGLTALHRCDHLKAISLSGRHWTKAGFLDFFRNCPRLTEVDVSYSSIPDGALLGLENCRGLTRLNLSHCILKSSDLSALAKKCPQLTSLDLSDIPNMTDSVIKAFAYYCSSLEDINLSKSSEITHSELGNLAKWCSKLETVYLQKCDTISEDNLNELRERYPSINFVRDKPVIKRQKKSSLSLGSKIVIGLVAIPIIAALTSRDDPPKKK